MKKEFEKFINIKLKFINIKFAKFLKSDFGLEIWSDEKVIFHSKRSGLQGLLQFIGKNENSAKDLVIFDKKVGNAAALLCAYVKAKEVFGLVGSETAKETFEKFRIKFYFSKTIPNILNKEETDICPMERMSLGKTPAEFLNLLKSKV